MGRWGGRMGNGMEGLGVDMEGLVGGWDGDIGWGGDGYGRGMGWGGGMG